MFLLGCFRRRAPSHSGGTEKDRAKGQNVVPSISIGTKQKSPKSLRYNIGGRGIDLVKIGGGGLGRQLLKNEGILSRENASNSLCESTSVLLKLIHGVQRLGYFLNTQKRGSIDTSCALSGVVLKRQTPYFRGEGVEVEKGNRSVYYENLEERVTRREVLKRYLSREGKRGKNRKS